MAIYKLKFKKWNCIVEKTNYRSNDRIALKLTDISTGEAVATATINLPDQYLEKDEVIIKDYSENEGMYNALVAAGYISKKIRIIQGNFVSFYVCKILI
jgi:hypothetical protein